uniref:Chemosensory protein n=1 Tax=Semiothisa cinerearia TaxID=2249628 RepID=A0A889XL58_9NEOP|nr:chemosensory protein [Semiothisa cinerearia]
MNWLILSAVLALAAFSAADQYTDRYDELNVDEIVANRRLLVPYIKCVLEQGKCTAEGKEMKAHIKDAMQTSCAKCTEKQRVKARKVVQHIKENEKDYWEQIKAKYDPGDKYKETYEAFLAADN